MRAIDLTGMVLKNRYCILEQIGKGGGGKVYLARDMELGVLRAVKELPLSGKREARILVKLEHHSLPKMVDYIENNQYCYIIMEYIKGESLSSILEVKGSLEVEEAVEYGISLTEVLSYLHGRKPPVFYGDLKPDNVMLSETGKLYLIDLGSAVIGYPRERNRCTGTEGFAAPEQFEGRICEASDVYGLGRTLEMFLGGDLLRIFLICPDLFLILRKCTFQKENRRYQNMEELAKALRKVRKRPIKAGMEIFAAAAVLCIAVVGVFLGAGYHHRNKTPDFYECLTEISDLYYKSEFRDGSGETRRAVCMEVEERLTELLKKSGTAEDGNIVRELMEGNRAILEKRGNETDNKNDKEIGNETESGNGSNNGNINDDGSINDNGNVKDNENISGNTYGNANGGGISDENEISDAN